MSSSHCELLDLSAQMEPLILNISGIDMNDVVNLTFYTQVIRFQMSPMQEETPFQDPDPLQQKAIHTWAQSLGFDYEYSLATRTARVVRAIPIDAAAVPRLDSLEFFDFDSSMDMGVVGDDLGTTNNDLRRMDVSHMEGLWTDPIIWPSVQAPLEHHATKDSSTQTDHPDPLDEEQVLQHMGLDKAQTLLNDPLHIDREENSSIFWPSSVEVERGLKSMRGRFGRRESAQSPASSGYQEIILNSDSSRVPSPATSGRRGPLDAAGRAAMKAVKAVRACWRCKFLRKTCGPENPCPRCPAGSAKSKDNNWSWPAVGCNRGSFREVLPPLYLCPALDPTDNTLWTVPFVSVRPDEEEWKVNSTHRVQLEIRAEALRRVLETSPQSQPTTLYSYLRTLDSETDGSLFKGFQVSSLVPPSSPLLVAFIPLEECITAVVYEAVQCVPYLDERFGDFPHIVSLLHSAAKYQAKMDSDELIAQSLICLRSSFEAFRLTKPSKIACMTQRSHALCQPGSCQIDCIRSLDENLGLYLNELSKVFFKKENMRVKEAWWLSTFYSFAIQGLIRRILQQLSNTTNGKSSTDQYLHLAIRLFVASSGDYDPLMRDYVTPANDKDVDSSFIQDLQEAKRAVKQDTWAERGIVSSANYLRNVFEDNGREICLNKDTTTRRDGVPALQGSSLGANSIQSHAVLQKEAASPAWPLLSQPTSSGSRPYRASSLSSVESSADIVSPYIATPVKNDNAHATFKGSPGFPSASPTTSITSQNASARASPGPYTFNEPAPPQSSYYPGSTFGQMLTFTTPVDIYHVPVDVRAASHLSDEKRARNAGASARFRQRRKEKEIEANNTIEKLQQQIRELEKLLSKAEAERDFFRSERDRFRDQMFTDAWRNDAAIEPG
ncbi:hypothetical protein BGZ57DRAFT_802906 [Hyaloscypha finlandica]|nr:hypothetical protein BGZ57DRAFT_802906 [Hyaloscypha finlandica]